MFSLDVASANHEILKLTLMRYRDSKKDKKLGCVTVDLCNAEFGVLSDWSLKLSSESGQIGITTHFAPPCVPPFTASPFVPTRLRVLFVEAVNLPRTDVLSQQDAYCKAQLSSDVAWARTRALKNTRTPQWYEVIDWWILGDYTAQTFVVRLCDENVLRDKGVAELKLPLARVVPGELSEGWFPMDGGQKVRLNLIFQVVLNGGSAFDPDRVANTPLPPDVLVE
jgi:Ca2+-dependent lipid-binding protein